VRYRHTGPELGRYVSRQSIELFEDREWYRRDGALDLNGVLTAWNERLAYAGR